MSSESLLDKVVQSVFLPESARMSQTRARDVDGTHCSLDTSLDDDKV